VPLRKAQKRKPRIVLDDDRVKEPVLVERFEHENDDEDEMRNFPSRNFRDVEEATRPEQKKKWFLVGVRGCGFLNALRLRGATIPRERKNGRYKSNSRATQRPDRPGNR
jgi:hypothetical protein